MGFRDELANVQPLTKIEAVFQALSKEEADELQQVIDDPLVPAAHIGVVLRRRGFDIHDRAIQRYRQLANERKALDASR